MITKAMIAAVRRTEKFYAGEDLTRESICHAAVEGPEFDKLKPGLVETRRFMSALRKAVWGK